MSTAKTEIEACAEGELGTYKTLRSAKFPPADDLFTLRQTGVPPSESKPITKVKLSYRFAVSFKTS